MAERMTVEELAALPGVHVGTKEAAAVLGCDRYSLNIAAKQGTLGLQYIFVGNRLKISKASLLEFCGYRPHDGGNTQTSGAVVPTIWSKGYERVQRKPKI